MGSITIKKQSAASVPNPATDQLKIFVDSADDILKTKDSFGVVRPSGVGTADELATTGAPVDVSAAAPPTAGQVLQATSPTSAVWAAAATALIPTAIQVGGASYNAAIGDLVRCNVTAGDLTVNLPNTHTSGTQIGVKMVSAAATNEVAILGSGGDLIDGSGSLNLTTDYEWTILMSDGTNWMRVG